VKLLLTWAVAPVVLTIAASWIQPCLAPRFLIPCVPALTVLLAAGIERGERRTTAVLLALIIFGMLMGTQPIGA
jgi:hypothetical protein